MQYRQEKEWEAVHIKHLIDAEAMHLEARGKTTEYSSPTNANDNFVNSIKEKEVIMDNASIKSVQS